MSRIRILKCLQCVYVCSRNLSQSASQSVDQPANWDLLSLPYLPKVYTNRQTKLNTILWHSKCWSQIYQQLIAEIVERAQTMAIENECLATYHFCICTQPFTVCMTHRRQIWFFFLKFRFRFRFHYFLVESAPIVGY